MAAKFTKKQILQRAHTRVRKKVFGNEERLRLSVHRSGKHIYAQVINDEKHETVASASSLDKEIRKSLKHGGNCEAAKKVGELVAKNALKKDVKKVAFDRGGHLYHGRIKELAEAAREAGLEF